MTKVGTNTGARRQSAITNFILKIHKSVLIYRHRMFAFSIQCRFVNASTSQLYYSLQFHISFSRFLYIYLQQVSFTAQCSSAGAYKRKKRFPVGLKTHFFSRYSEYVLLVLLLYRIIKRWNVYYAARHGHCDSSQGSN